jgi:3-oxoadipate enol-lactonase
VTTARLPDGARIAYEVLGAASAPPILLVSPLGAWRGAWAAFGEALARELRVVVFDARGTGDSSDAPWRATTRSMGRDAHRVLDALGVGRAHVYGISLGGMVATWLAIDAPERISSLVLASTAARGAALRRDARAAASMARCLTRAPAARAACLAERTLSERFRGEQPDRVAAIRAAASLRPAPARSLLLELAAALRHDARSRLGEVRADTLVIAGARDTLLPPEAQRRFARRLPRASFEVVDAGHDVSTEAPDAVAARVLAHVARVGR